jgi:hypothetical protein
MTYLKEQMAIAAFTVGKDTQIMSLSRDLVQCLYRLFKEATILLTTIYFPNEPTGSIQQ